MQELVETESMSEATESKEDSVLRCGDYPLDEVVSALQKEIRRGSQEHAFYWASTMVEFGYEEYMWRRLMVILGEDIGHCDRTVAPFVIAMYQANEDRHSQGKRETPNRHELSGQCHYCHVSGREDS